MVVHCIHNSVHFKNQLCVYNAVTAVYICMYLKNILY